jgi:hypothetical protein
MPHIPGKRYVVASCHVERPLDDRCWAAFSSLQARRPAGLAVAALLRPPDPAAGEDEDRWLERAREAAARAPLGHHTHFVAPAHARPQEGGEEHAGRVRSEARWLREQGLAPRLFCGGGWYLDAAVAGALAEEGYADCTATAFRPGYLPPGAPRLAGSEPTWLELEGGRRLLELPTTHSRPPPRAGPDGRAAGARPRARADRSRPAGRPGEGLGRVRALQRCGFRPLKTTTFAKSRGPSAVSRRRPAT